MAWDESKHPRIPKGNKNGGQFRCRGYSSTESDINKLINRASLSLHFFGKNNKGIEHNTDIPSPPCEAFGFANKERLYTEHHIKHATEMGFKDQKEYERAAIEFWNSGQGKLYYSPLRKHYYLYNSNKSRIISVNSDGIIQTFFSISQKKFDKLSIQERLYVY